LWNKTSIIWKKKDKKIFYQNPNKKFFFLFSYKNGLVREAVQIPAKKNINQPFMKIATGKGHSQKYILYLRKNFLNPWDIPGAATENFVTM